MKDRLQRLWHAVSSGNSLKKILPAAIALALLAYVVQVALHADLATQLWQVVVGVGWISLLIAIPFFGLRAVTWAWLIAQLHLSIPRRQLLVAFAAGELAKSLPGGIYLQSYVLARLENFGEEEIVQATMATTGMDVHQGAISFFVAMIIGVPGAAWFRPLLGGVAAIWVGLIGAGWLIERVAHPGDDRSDPGWLRRARRLGAEVVRAATDLLTPAAINPFLATVVYSSLYALNLYLVLAALGIDKVGVTGALVVVAATNLANDMLPIPLELGLTEVSGYGILAAHGVSTTTAATAMLAYRVVTTGALILVTGAVLLVLRREVVRAASGG